MADTYTLQLPDGRTLGYALMGADQGDPLITCHGLPGSRMESYLIHDVARKLNLRIITPDRPGYGLSTPLAGGSLLQRSKDIVYLADHLDISSFSIIGVSGGAPCALACAAHYAHRIRNIALVCGLGPLNCTGLLKKMDRFSVLSFWLAYHYPFLLKITVGASASVLANISPAFVLQTAGLFSGGEDRKLLKEPQVKQWLTLNVREAFRQGSIGAVHDMQLYSRDWGFQLADIDKAIEIWHGDADRVVPLSHSEFMHSRLPDSRLTVVPGEAHFSLPIRHAEEILQQICRQG